MSQAVHFTGTGAYCLDDFLMQFRQVAAINKWPESDLALILGAYLQGPALAYFKLIYSELDFKGICELLKAEFPSSVDYTEKFYNARQGANEEVMAFFYTLADLALKAEIKDERTFIKAFLKGVTPNYKFKLGSRVYASKEELKATLEQIKEIFGEAKHEVVNLPLHAPKGILNKVRIEHPLSMDSQRPPFASRPSSPAPSRSAATPPRSAGDHRDGDTFHTPRYNLRPRYQGTSRSYRSPFAPSTRSPTSPSRPNDQGHRR